MTGAAASPETHVLIAACDRRTLTDWESEFVTSVRNRRRPLTGKQMTVLRKIAAGWPNYAAINAVALRSLPDILERWLPGGKVLGREYVTRNPRRGDRAAGSFSVNTHTGEWADFATNDRGKDVISLAAWLFGLAQSKAAENVAAMLGLDIGEGSRHG